MKVKHFPLVPLGIGERHLILDGVAAVCLAHVAMPNRQLAEPFSPLSDLFLGFYFDSQMMNAASLVALFQHQVPRRLAKNESGVIGAFREGNGVKKSRNKFFRLIQVFHIQGKVSSHILRC